MEWFTVKYRQPDGVVSEAEFEAADRPSLFKLLEQKKITAISVTNGRTGKKTRKATNNALSPSAIKWVIVGVSVFAIAIVCWIVASKYAAKQEPPKKKVTRVAQKVVPPPAPMHNDVESNTNKEEKIDIHKVYRDGNGKVIYNPEAPVGSPANPIKYGWIDRPGNHPPPKKLYDTFPENYLVGLLRTKPGHPVVNMSLPRDFDKQFIERIADPVGIKDDDTEEDAELRRQVKEIKQKMAQMIASGMTPSEILKAERKELNRLAMVKTTVLREIADLRKSGASQDEIDLAVEAGNKMLEQYGVEHIKIPEFLKQGNLTKINENEGVN